MFFSLRSRAIWVYFARRSSLVIFCLGGLRPLRCGFLSVGFFLGDDVAAALTSLGRSIVKENGWLLLGVQQIWNFRKM